MQRLYAASPPGRGRHPLEAHEQCHRPVESAAIPMEMATRSKTYQP